MRMCIWFSKYYVDGIEIKEKTVNHKVWYN